MEFTFFCLRELSENVFSIVVNPLIVLDNLFSFFKFIEVSDVINLSCKLPFVLFLLLVLIPIFRPKAILTNIWIFYFSFRIGTINFKQICKLD